MKNISFLSKSFFRRCVDRDHKEILQKDDRPYFSSVTKIDGVTWGIPFRSSIKHPHAFWADKPNRCGIDYAKVAIAEDKGDVM